MVWKMLPDGIFLVKVHLFILRHLDKENVNVGEETFQFWRKFKYAHRLCREKLFKINYADIYLFHLPLVPFEVNSSVLW